MRRYILYTYIFFLSFGIISSCFNDEGFAIRKRGMIRNESDRNIYIVISSDISEKYDDNLYYSTHKYNSPYKLLRHDSTPLLFSIHKIVTGPKELIFDYYDWDTIAKYYKHRKIFGEYIPGLGKKAFLKSDIIAQDELLKNKVLLIFKENESGIQNNKVIK